MKNQLNATFQRDSIIAKTILENMTEEQKEDLYQVIQKHNIQHNELLHPVVFGDQEQFWFPAINISFVLAGQVVLKKLPLQGKSNLQKADQSE